MAGAWTSMLDAATPAFFVVGQLRYFYMQMGIIMYGNSYIRN